MKAEKLNVKEEAALKTAQEETAATAEDMEEMEEEDEDEGWGEIQERKMTNLIRKPSFNSLQFILFANFYVKIYSNALLLFH